jgi:cell wall-associated NlpC family hydrolase
MPVNRSRRLTALAIVTATVLMSEACASAAAGTAGPAAFPRAPVPPVPDVAARSANGNADEPLGTAVGETARSLVGIPYRLGGHTPREGFDCSGLVWYALAQHQIVMPRTVAEQYSIGAPVAADDLQPGDLIFFSTIGPGATHVGIVLDAAGTGTFVHAPSEGGAVRVERFDTSYWQSRYVGARRVF